MPQKDQKTVTPRTVSIPSSEEVEAERDRLMHNRKKNRTVKAVVFVLIAVIAVVVLLGVFFLQRATVSGTDMEPTLFLDDVVVIWTGGKVHAGDVIAYSHGDETAVKRVIGCPGDVIDIDEDGRVSVTYKGQDQAVELDEPYVAAASLGVCDISLPYRVKQGQYFVMGDNRSTSLDSRSKEFGCVKEGRIMGRAVACIWPLSHLGIIR